MCIIIHKPVAGKIPSNILDNAERINGDGFGITFMDTMETVVTMDYAEARILIEGERPFVAHYRYATKGVVSEENCHPFAAKTGVLYSNGTVADLGDKDNCDTQIVADILHRTPKRYWKDILSMSSVRFCIVDKGKVERYGEWHERDGVFYSKNNCFAPAYTAPNRAYYGGSGHGYGYSSNHDWRNKPSTSNVPVRKTGVIGFGANYTKAHEDEEDYHNIVELPEPAIEVDVVEVVDQTDIDTSVYNQMVYEIDELFYGGELEYDDYMQQLYQLELEYSQNLLDDDYGAWGDDNVLAAYGTLKRTFCNHSIIKGSTFLGYGRSVEKMRMGGNGIPYLYEGDHPLGANVRVELYDVTDVRKRVSIDALEDHPSHYERKRKMFTLDDGKKVEAWVYLAQHEPRRGSEFYSEFQR